MELRDGSIVGLEEVNVTIVIGSGNPHWGTSI